MIIKEIGQTVGWKLPKNDWESIHDGCGTDDDNNRDHYLIGGDVLDGFSLRFPPTFSRRPIWGDILDDEGDVEVHDNGVRVRPMVNNEVARGVAEICVTGVDVCGSFYIVTYLLS